MPYLIDCDAALRTGDLVAIIAGSRRSRSRVILRDNGLYRTPTAPKTLMRCAEGGAVTVVRRRRSNDTIWWEQR
jgi:hypothetical protein